MGLDQVFRDLPGIIFDAFTDSGGIVKTISYVVVGTPTYNPTTGANVSTDVTKTLRGVLVAARLTTTDNTAQGTRIRAMTPNEDSVRVLMSGKELSAQSVVPKEDDYMTIEGVRYEITQIRQTPDAALYTFFVRAP